MIEGLTARALLKGSDSDFRGWIQRQRSCLSGLFSEYLDDGTGRCEAAHVRRAGESGTGYKAPFACIPLTRQEHAMQHSKHGEAGTLKRFLGGEWAPEAAKAWFDERRIEYLTRWIEL